MARVLVIEDNPANLELMAYLLRAFGHSVEEATDGAMGIERALADPPDLVVCDIQLPAVDGYEVTRRLKATAPFRGRPILAVTAFAMVGDRQRILAAGFDGYISKPIDPESFVRQLEAFLPSSRAAPEPAPPRASVSAAPAAPARASVLLADEWPEEADIVRAALEPRGYRVIAVSALADAVETARSLRPDVILSDAVLGGGSGEELLCALRADESLAGIPFVLIGTERLARPIEPGALLSLVEALTEPWRRS